MTFSNCCNDLPAGDFEDVLVSMEIVLKYSVEPILSNLYRHQSLLVMTLDEGGVF